MVQGEKGEVELGSSVVIPGPHVRLSPEAVPVGPRRHVPAAEPRVELVREGDVIRAIDVICGCGSRVRLRCHYPEQG